MFKATRVIIAGSHHTARELPDACRSRTIYLPENGIDPARFHPVEKPTRPPPVRACFVGRLVPYKGPDMLIEAAAPHMRTGDLHLDIVGDGPMMQDLKAKTADLGVAGAVTLHGWVDPAEVAGILGRAHVLTFPSIREFGGGVVLEAMAMGATPVVVNYGGPGELVSGGYGIAIPLGTREQIVARLTQSLAEIVADPAGTCLPPEMLRGLVEEEFSWPAKARKIGEIYSKLISADTCKSKSGLDAEQSKRIMQ